MLTPSIGFWAMPLTVLGAEMPVASRIVGTMSITWWNWLRMPYGRGQVPFRIADVGIDRRGVAEEVRLPLASVSADEAVEVLEAHADRPLVERPVLARLEHRRVVVLAEPRCPIAVVLEDPADGCLVASDDRDRAVVTLPAAPKSGPSVVKVLIPFTNPVIVGKFVYHCHIIQHEDQGMMANIQVVDPAAPPPDITLCQ